MANKTPSKKVFDRLAYAVDAYVNKCGGKAVVIGGIRIAKRSKFRFTIEIDFTGSFPEK